MCVLPTDWRSVCVRAVLTAVLASAVPYYRVAADCPYGDSAWARLRSSQRERLLDQPPLESLDESCLAALLRRQISWPESTAGERAIGHLAAYLAMRGSHDGGLLVMGLRLGLPQCAPSAWRQVCRDWERVNGPLRAAVAALKDSGKVQAADSLYAVFDAAGELSVSQYLEWFALRHMLRDYEGAVAALCRLSAGERRLDMVARGQISNMLNELDTAAVRRTLHAYRDCYLARPGADTADLRLWLARTYAQAGLYHDEIAVVVELESPERPSLDYLLAAARRHYGLKRYAEALTACRAAWLRTQTDDTRSLCAGIMYESHTRLGRRDSASVWLARTSLGSVRSVAQAVVFYQTTGAFGKADSLLRFLAPGPVRDTLRIRQFLFNGAADSALAYATSLLREHRWRAAGADARLWVVRTALFAGDLVLFERHLDSLRFEPTWEYAGEVLNYRYRLVRFGGDQTALAAWPAFELALYVGRLRDAEAAVARERCIPPNAADFTVRLVREWLVRGEAAQAARVAGAVDPATTPPEQLYYCAEALYRQGRLVQARELLEHLLLRHPSSIYASKARLLLAHVQS